MKSNNLVLNSWIDESAKVLSKEVFNLIKSQGSSKGVVGSFCSKFIEYMVQESVYDSLTNISNKYIPSNEEAYNLTRDSFSSLKEGLQNSIAIGFEKAVEKYSGKPLNYYCIIRPIPEAINNLPS